MTIPPPPPARPAPGASFLSVVLALCALAVAASHVWLGLNVVKALERMRLASETAAARDEPARATAEGLVRLRESLALDAELARTTAAVATFDNVVESRPFELEHALACLSFLELMSRKPNFDNLAADPERDFSKSVYSKAVFDIEGVSYATKDGDHPMTRELKSCLSPAAGQERIPFPDEFSAIVFRDRFDTLADAIAYPRVHLALHTLAVALREYQDLSPRGRKLIDGEVGEWACKTSVRRLFLRKTDSAVIKAKFAEGRYKAIDGYIGANCPR